MERQLIFVYNAKSGFMHGAMDLMHKSVSPATYPCKLCQITYSGATMNKIWKDYIASLDIHSTFLHKNEFEQKYPNITIGYPAVLMKNGKSLKVILDTDDFNKLNDLGELMNKLSEKLSVAKTNKKLYQCPECSLHYEDEGMAKQCEAFCKKYNGCSLEITALSEEAKAQK